MWPALIGGAASLVGGWLGYKGQKDANAANAQQARENRDFQERMSNTSWQRGTEDMAKAGLNPGLAYQKGGADTPSGTTAHMDSTMAGAGASARDAANSFATMQQAKANTRLTNAQASQLEIESVDRATKVANEAVVSRLDRNYLDTIKDERVRGFTAEAGAKDLALKSAREEYKYLPSRLERENNVLAPLTLDLLRQQIGLASSNARSASAQATLYEYAQAEARNRSAAANTLWGRNIAPYLNDANSVLKLMPFVKR